MNSKSNYKVLVTGGSGFIGGFLLERLVQEGYDVYSMLRYSTGRYVLGAREGVKTVYADLREGFRVREVIANIQPDVIFHLAAISAQSYSYAHPQEVTETNFLGTINLAEAAYKLIPHFKLMVFTGSAEEYGVQPHGIPIEEDQAQLNPHSPYAVSKVCCDYYLMYMCNAFNFPVTILRSFNSYGRRDNAHFLIERIISQMLADPSGDVYLGDPEPVISWMYVDDYVDGLMAVFNKPDKSIGEHFNLCTKTGHSIRQVAEKCKHLIDFKGRIFWETIPERPIRVTWLVGNPNKAKRLLDWEAKVSLDDGLQRTVDIWRKKLISS